MLRYLFFAAFCFLCAVITTHAQTKTASDWVTQARQAEQFTKKHVINVDDSCKTTIRQGGIDTTSDPATGTPVTNISVVAGEGTIVDICSTGTSLTQTFKAEELFAGAAVWKVVSTSGYVEGDQLRECKANPGKCCSIYFVPLTSNATAIFQADIESCTSNKVSVNIAGGSATTAPVTYSGIYDEELDDATQIEVEATLVFDPNCGLAPPSSEGVDGIIEGSGEGEGSSPPVPEGADGIVEGNGEGMDPAENADGVIEGGVLPGESMEGEGTGDTNEGEGSVPGTGEGEGTGRRLRATQEEGDSTADTTTAVWYWSKGHTVNQNSLVDPAAPDPMEGGVSEGSEGTSSGSSTGEGEGTGETNEGEGAMPGTGAGEGEGQATRRLLSDQRLRSATRQLYSNKLMYNAKETPIQLVVNATYKLQISMVRAPAAAYFSATELFANSLVRNIEDSGAVIEFKRPTAVEMYAGVGYFYIYMKPLKAGSYTFKSTDNTAVATEGRIEVVNSVDDLGDSKTFTTHDVGTAACGTDLSTLGPQQETQTQAPTSAAASGMNGLVALMVALGALAALL